MDSNLPEFVIPSVTLAGKDGFICLKGSIAYRLKVY